MKPFSIQPFSALAGAGLVGLVLMAAGAVQVRANAHLMGRSGPVPPADLVVVREGYPYTVPAAKRLVITAFGSANPTVASVQILIDMVPEVTTHTETPTTIRQVPRWLVVNSGSTIAVAWGDGTPDDGRAWGYLVDA